VGRGFTAAHGVLVLEHLGVQLAIQHQHGCRRSRDVLGTVGLGRAEVDDDLLGDDADGVVAGFDNHHGTVSLVGAEVATHFGDLGLVELFGRCYTALGCVDDSILADGVEEQWLFAVRRDAGLARLEAGLLGPCLADGVVRINRLCLLVLAGTHEYS